MRRKCFTSRCKTRIEEDRGPNAFFCRKCAEERAKKQKREWWKKNRGAAA